MELVTNYGNSKRCYWWWSCSLPLNVLAWGCRVLCPERVWQKKEVAKRCLSPQSESCGEGVCLLLFNISAPAELPHHLVDVLWGEGDGCATSSGVVSLNPYQCSHRAMWSTTGESVVLCNFACLSLWLHVIC